MLAASDVRNQGQATWDLSEEQARAMLQKRPQKTPLHTFEEEVREDGKAEISVCGVMRFHGNFNAEKGTFGKCPAEGAKIYIEGYREII